MLGNAAFDSMDVEDTEAKAIALELMSERIAELELELEDVGWLRSNWQNKQEFTNSGLEKIVTWSRIMRIKNPLIKHAVEVQCDYIWAQDVTFNSKEGEVRKALDDFLYNPKNVAELTGHQARWSKEDTLQTDGNVFLVLFTKKGKTVIVRSIPVEEILAGDIITDPQDRLVPWYYKRVWTAETFDPASGARGVESRTDYYPDIDYNPDTKPATIGRAEVHWDSPVLHLKNGIGTMRFGIPEVYAALPWARSVVRDMDNYSTVRTALARFAWSAETKGGKPAIAALKNRLQSKVTQSEVVETNPPPSVGSTFIGQAGQSLTPMRTAGASPGTEDGKGLRFMVGAGVGLPESILTGDASSGSLATAKSLDRPTELKMRNRQTLWSEVFKRIFIYAVGTKLGKVRGSSDDYYFKEALGDGNDKDAAGDWELNIDFPPILERDAAGRVAAVISAATLDGKAKAGTMTDKTLVLYLFQALGMDDDSDEQIAKLKFDKDDMFIKPPEAPGAVAGGGGSPGGPTPGPNPGAPPDRQAQGLAKQEPAATASQTPYRAAESVDELIALVREARVALEEGRFDKGEDDWDPTKEGDG